MSAAWMLVAFVCTGDPLADIARSQAGPASLVVGTSDAPPIEESPKADPLERYLLLCDDSVVAGNITPLGGDYRVERHGGRMTIPGARVQFLGDSLRAVYEYKSHRIPIQDAEARRRLAEWCFHEGLFEYALAEAKLVQRLDPNDDTAARVQKLCETRLNPPEPRVSPVASTQRTTQKARRPDPTRVIAQFKRAYGQDAFDRYADFEPLLMRNCGSSACHGSTRHEGPFRLHRRGHQNHGDVAMTARNLMSVLDAIDYHDPHRSPLLYKSLEKHGAILLPPLGGPQDPIYIQLQEWVFEVTARWSGNKIHLNPEQVDELQSTGPWASRPMPPGDQSFGEGREELQPEYVRRNGRPQPPVFEPGDDIQAVRFGTAVADDAPAPPAMGNRPPVQYSPLRARSAPGEPIPADQFAVPAGAPDPNDRSQLETFEEQPQPGPLKRAASRLVDMVSGRPKVRMTMTLPGTKEGELFEAAAVPLSLQSTMPAIDMPAEQAPNTNESDNE